MNRKEYFLLITKILIILMFFVYFVENLLILTVSFLVIIMIIFSKLFFYNVDSNKIIILIYAILLVFTLIINLENYGYVNMEGGSLYVKTALNGLLWIFIAYFGYFTGKILGYNESLLNNLLKFCIGLFLINAVTNIYIWITTTGGVISRYNFVSPITNSVSAGILYSLLGFFLVLALPFKKKYINFIIITIFIVNIVIIGTRQVQIMFCLYLIYYYFLSFVVYRSKRVKIFSKTLLMLPIILLIVVAIFPALSSMYKGIFDLESQDYYVRQITQEVAYNLFLDNPIFGVGYGMFGVYNTAVIPGTDTTLGSPHNGFFSVISEWGISGFLLTMCLFINIYIVTRKILKNSEENSKVDLVSIVFLRGVILIFFISNFDLFPPPNERNYYLFGFILWILYGSMSKRINKTNVNLSNWK